MAQFTPQGRAKLLSNGERSLRLDSKHTFSCRSVGLLPLHDRSSTKIYSYSPSRNRSSRNRNLSTDPPQNVGRGGGIDDECDEEYDSDDLACFRSLVLDLAYRPVNVVCWRRAICLEFMEKVGLSADVLEYYDQTVNSPSGSFYIPAVLRVPHLLQVVKRKRIPNSLTRKNVFFRDNYTCQYCSLKENLTIDHVFPLSRGGQWAWENLVTACARCNSKKGQKTVEEANMKLLKVPKVPKDYDVLAIPLTSSARNMLSVRNGTPEEWRQYLARPYSGPRP